MAADPSSGPSVITSLAILLLGSAITFAAQIGHRRASQRADTFRDRLDELCDEVKELSIVAGSYWATEPTSPDLQRLEAQTFALNHRVSMLAGLLGEQKDDFRQLTEDKVIDLSIAATGADFQVVGRAADPSRYIQIEQRAMDLERAVRRHQRRSLAGWFW